ncbi:MAG: hypothetical protein HYT11_01380 [Candidatus Levybacteria bacterium]|nr:hypothetical protein [Candidatus Levybacteria bacterium]
MKKIIFAIAILFILSISFFIKKTIFSEIKETSWSVQSIDTMKYSRDPSREKLHDPSFYAVIEQQVNAIAETGTTHISIGTPYDDEFLPILREWVKAARSHNLNVWFRGNWSGWEEWFDYQKITISEHIAKTEKFILSHPELFEDGDVFTPCPECENGGPGDPRRTGDVAEYRKFLMDEYKVTSKAFKSIKKNVASNYLSMNGDVARLIMDKETTKKLDGIVTIDHYVRSPEKLVSDIKEIARNSGGQVVLGEWGAPINDIHGSMSEEQQAVWINAAFEQLTGLPELKGMNYWTSFGGSTELWDKKGNARKAVSVLTKYYIPSKTTILENMRKLIRL